MERSVKGKDAEDRSEKGRLPTLGKGVSLPTLALREQERKGGKPLMHPGKSMSLAAQLFEDYKPRGEDPYDSTPQDAQERRRQLKKMHLATLQSKLHKSFQQSHELTKAIDLSFSVSSVKDSDLEIDKILLKTRNSMLKFQEQRLDLRRERLLRAQGAKADTRTVKTLIHAVLSKFPQLVKPMLKECQTTFERVQMINVCDQFDRTALHYACFMGSLAVCEKLLGAGGNATAKDYMLRTPLHYAVIGNREQIIEALVRHKSHAEKKDFQSHQRPSFASIPRKSVQLPEAVFLSKTDLMDYAGIIQEMDSLVTELVSPSFQPTQIVDEGRFLDSQDQFFRTPLHYAALKENYSIIKLLCSLGASLDLEDCERRRAADLTDHQAIKKFMISRMRVSNAQGETQLSLDLRDLMSLSQKEIQFGAFLQTQDTYLMQAVRKKELSAVKYLLEHGALLTRTNKNHWTALHIAVKLGSMPVVRLMLEGFVNKETNEEVHTWKLEAWKALDMVTAQGYSVLHLAAKHEDNTEVIQYLVKSIHRRRDWTDNHPDRLDSDLPPFMAFETLRELRCKGGFTALLLAVRCYNLSIVKYLVKHGANIYAKTEALQNALHIAAQMEDRDIVEFLIYQDSDDNILRSEVDIRLRKPRDIDITGKLASSFYHVWDYAGMGNVQRVKALITSGVVTVNEQTKRKQSSILHVAVEKAQVVVVKELITLGADVTIKNSAGKTPSDMAAAIRDVRYESIIYRLIKGEDADDLDDQELQVLSQAYRPFAQTNAPIEEQKETIVYAEEWTAERRAIVTLIRDKLVARGMSVADAFELVDKDKDFCLEKVEFEGLLLWLGIHASAGQVADLLHSLDRYQTGRIEYSAVVNHIKEANKVIPERVQASIETLQANINLSSKLFRGSSKPPDKISFSQPVVT